MISDRSQTGGKSGRAAVVCALFAVALALVPLSHAPSAASAAPVTTVRTDNGSVSSTNWSGYAVNGSAGSVSAATMSWVVPAVTCPASGTLYSSFWVGIDGFQSSTVEQTGTDSDCIGGVPTYYAWYEFYPSLSHKIGMAVHPGDVMGALVFFSSGTFKAAIKDETTGKTFGTSSAVSGAARSSAEFIAEAPTVCILLKCSLASLANFGTASFGYDYTKIAVSCGLQKNGVIGSIGAFGSSVQKITMVSQANPSLVKAQPSSLTSDGLSFTLQWLNSGP